MKKLASLVLLTLAVFFMVGCGTDKEKEIDVLPALELVGDTIMEVEQYSVFVDPGIGIIGDFDLEAVVESDVDTTTMGDYTVTYTITYLEEEYVVSRTVRVVALGTEITPGLQLTGDVAMEVEQYTTFVDPGVELLGGLALNVVVDSNVDTSIIGSYTITYTITYMEVDYVVSRVVDVVPVTLNVFPSIELIGDASMEVEQYTVFVDPGVTTIGDVVLDIAVANTVDANTIGTYTVVYSYMYGGLYYSKTRTVEVVEAPPLFELALSLVEVTDDAITVNVDYKDEDRNVSNTLISLYKGDVFIESFSFKLGNDDVEFIGLDDNTMYYIEITGDYLLDSVPTVLTGYFLNVTTNETIDLSFSIMEPNVGVDTIDFGIEITDPATILTDLVAKVYQGDTLIDTIELFDDIFIGEVEADLGFVWVTIEGLALDTEYAVEIEYTYNSAGSAGEVTLQLAKVDYTTLSFYTPLVVSNTCNERYYALYCEIDIDFTDYDDSYYVVAKLYEDGTFKKQFTLTNNYTTYDFEYLSDDTEYTIEIYADYTHTASQGSFSYVLIGTYEVKTILSGSLAAPTIENIVITNTNDTITVDFDFLDPEFAMERGFVYLVRGWSNLSTEQIVIGHNTIVFNEYIDENELYTILIKVDHEGNGSFDTYHEEDVFIPPVITIDNFEPAEMFFLGDNVVMKLTLDNDEKFEITAVTINGTRYDTFDFPSGTETLYVDLGVKLVATYPIVLQNIIITFMEEEYVIAETSSADVTVYAVGSVDPDDATVAVIDIIPQEYISPIDQDNENFKSTVLTDVYLDNKYSLPVTGLKIGGIEYSGADITVISPTHIQVTVEFQYGSENSSSSSLYFSHIKFERNGVEITGLDGSHANESIYVYAIGGPSPTQFTYITNETEFMAMETGNDQVGIFILQADLDFTGIDYTPIGTYENKFSGTFLGNGHTISNVTINKTFAADNDLNYVGLFGYSAASIYDLTLDNINITINTTEDNRLFVGILAGEAYGGYRDIHVYNSSIEINGMVKGNVGGLIGGSYHYQITGLYRTSTDTDITITTATAGVVDDRLYVGGLVGHQTQGDVRHSSATGDIFVAFGFHQDVFAGGLLGGAGEYVSNSYATGNVTATANGYSRIGGLIGRSLNENGYIVNCYATGDVTTSYATIGGLIGEVNGYVVSSFATGTVISNEYNIGLLLGKASYLKLDHLYGYDETINMVVTYYLYDNSIVASSIEYNDSDYYVDFLGWSTHFFDFSILDIENGDLPIFP